MPRWRIAEKRIAVVAKEKSVLVSVAAEDEAGWKRKQATLCDRRDFSRSRNAQDFILDILREKGRTGS